MLYTLSHLTDCDPMSYTASSGAQSNSRIPFQTQRRESGNGFSGGPPSSYQYVGGAGYVADPDIDMPVHSRDER